MLSKFCFEFWSKVFTPGGMYLSQTLSLQGFLCCLLLGWRFWSISNQWFGTHDSQKFIIWRRKLKAPGFTKVHHYQPTSDFRQVHTEWIHLTLLFASWSGRPSNNVCPFDILLWDKCTRLELKLYLTSNHDNEFFHFWTHSGGLHHFLVKVLHICAKLTKKLQK
jgi:hypothetical protein